MIVYGYDSIASELEKSGYLFKLIANDTGIVFFPYTQEHRDANQPGIRYADDSQGNALAAMVKPGCIEFRFHRKFSDEHVTELIGRMLKLPELEFAQTFSVTYQSRVLIPGSE